MSTKSFYYTVTYYMSGPIAKWISPFIVQYFGISPLISPICVELASYAIIQPVHYFIIVPLTTNVYNRLYYNHKLLCNDNDLILSEYTIID